MQGHAQLPAGHSAGVCGGAGAAAVAPAGCGSAGGAAQHARGDPHGAPCLGASAGLQHKLAPRPMPTSCLPVAPRLQAGVPSQWQALWQPVAGGLQALLAALVLAGVSRRRHPGWQPALRLRLAASMVWVHAGQQHQLLLRPIPPPLPALPRARGCTAPSRRRCRPAPRASPAPRCWPPWAGCLPGRRRALGRRTRRVCAVLRRCTCARRGRTPNTSASPCVACPAGACRSPCWHYPRLCALTPPCSCWRRGWPAPCCSAASRTAPRRAWRPCAASWWVGGSRSFAHTPAPLRRRCR